jgi:hypothetical protein
MKRREQTQRVRLTEIAARLALMAVLAALVLGMALVQPAQTAGTSASPLVVYDYGWENNGTILGSSGNLAAPANVASGWDPEGSTTVTPHGGSAMLQVTEAPHASTPQAYVAFVEDLAHGDEVSASFWGWDSTPGASPSLRIWAHYAQSGDVTSYAGSAGGNDIYTDGTGWSQIGWTWTFDSSSDTRDALVIEVRLYSTPSTSETASTDFWVDDLQVTVPATPTVSFPADPTAVRLGSFGASPAAGGLVFGLFLAALTVACFGVATVASRRMR